MAFWKKKTPKKDAGGGGGGGASSGTGKSEEDGEVTVKIGAGGPAYLNLRGLYPDSVRGRTFTIPQDGMIGSLPQNAVCVQDDQKSVSRTHCRVVFSPSEGCFHIADLNSSNGSSLTTDKATFKLSPQTFFQLQPGYIIHIGAEIQLGVLGDEEDLNTIAPVPVGPGGALLSAPRGGGGPPVYDSMQNQGSYQAGPPRPNSMGNGGVNSFHNPGYNNYDSNNFGSVDYGQVEEHQAQIFMFTGPQPSRVQSDYVYTAPSNYGASSMAPATVENELAATLAALHIPSAYASTTPDNYGSASVGQSSAATKVKVYLRKLDGGQEVNRVNLSQWSSTPELITGCLSVYRMSGGRVTYVDKDGDEIAIKNSTDFNDVLEFAVSLNVYPNPPKPS